MSTNEPDGPPTDGGWQPPPPPPPPPPPYGGGYQQPAYGQQPPAAPYGYQPYAAPPQTEGTAVGALVASILSYVVCPIIPAIVALVLIPGARRKIAESQGRLTGESLLTAAKWISLIHLALVALAVVGIILLIIVGAATSTTSNSDFSFVGGRVLTG